MTIRARVKPYTNFDHIDQLKGQYRISLYECRNIV